MMPGAGMKAQASAEMLLILAVSTVIIMLVIMMAQQQITTVQAQKDSMDAQNAVLDLSAAAREVYAQGEGSKKMVFVRLPGSYDPGRSYVGNRSIGIRAAGTDYVSLENFNVHGYLPSGSGGQWIWVVSEGNRVRIGLALMELSRNRVYVVMDSNSTASQSFSIKNTWVRNISINLSTTWTTAEVSVGGIPASIPLGANATEPITVQFGSSEEAAGFYYGSIALEAVDGTGATESAVVPVTVEVINPDKMLPIMDVQGPLISSIYQVPVPAVKYEPLELLVNATDVLTGNNSIRGCLIDADNSGNWQTMLPEDGAFNQPSELAIFNYTSGFSLGPHTIRARCADSMNNTGPLAYYYFNVSEADLLGPIVIQMRHTDFATTMSNISVGGVATDAYTGVNSIAGCNVKVGTLGSWVPAEPDDGTWDSVSENFTYYVGTLPVGIYPVFYQCNDSVGNQGGVYNDTIGVVDVDFIVALDRSGSMAWNVTNFTNSNTVSATSTGWSNVKSLTITATNGDPANVTTQIRSSVANCLTSYNITINGVEKASGNTTSTSNVNMTDAINLSGLYPPFNVTLWLKRNATGCTAYNSLFSLQQLPPKMDAVKNSSKAFLDIAGNNVQAGLVSFSTSATTDDTLAIMAPVNQTALKNSIDSLSASGSTCIECALRNACTELNSSRSRPTATKVVVLLTDGVGNVCYGSGSCSGTECMGCSVAGGVYCRDRDVTVYAIGFGSDVDDAELTNIALITGGDYYFAPNVETLTAIFQSIGRH
jgi:hypothetical protein